jgi:hypothetical protein
MRIKLQYVVTLIASAVINCAIAQMSWNQLSSSGGPPQPRYGHTAVLNSSNGRMIVFGGVFGTTGAPPLGNDVWIFKDARSNQGNTWEQLSVSGPAPSPRGYQTAVYDQANNRMIIFGGDPAVGFCYEDVNDVWVLTNADGTGGSTGWVQLAPTGTPPSIRSWAAAVYDQVNNRMILYGGNEQCDTPYGDLWVLADANGLGGTPNWIQLSSAGAGPGPRTLQSVAYDSANNRMILFGGQAPSAVYTNDTWVLSNANGLGGTPTWALLNPNGPLPPPRYTAGATYDPASNSLVIFGGEGPSGSTNDIWVLSNANGLGGAPVWSLVQPSGSVPDGRQMFSCLGVPGASRMVIYAGLSSGGNIYNDVWALQYASSNPLPALGIAQAGNQEVLYWPVWATSYALQMKTSLSSTNWVTVSNGTPIIGVTLTNALPAAFFRLQQQ